MSLAIFQSRLGETALEINAIGVQVIKVKLLRLNVTLAAGFLKIADILTGSFALTAPPALDSSRGSELFVLLLELDLVLADVVLDVHLSLHFFFDYVLDLQLVSVLLLFELMLDHLLDLLLLSVLLLFKLIHRTP